MPITGSLGALTYTKETVNLPFGGWMFMITTPNSGYDTSFFDSTDQIIYNAYAGGGGSKPAVISSISSFINPILSNVGNITLSGTGNNAMTLYEFTSATRNGGNIMYVGQARGPYPSTFPYYSVGSGFLLYQNTTTGNLIYNFQFPKDGASPSGNDQSQKWFNDIAFDSSNNMYIIGSDSTALSSTTFKTDVYLYRYGSPSATTLYTQTYTPNSSSGGQLNGRIVINNNDEPIIVYESLNSYIRLVVSKISNTVISGKQDPIWTVGLKSTANAATQLGDLKIDSNSNIFISTSRAGGARIIKLDSNGNLLWTRGFGLIDTAAFGLPKIAIKNDNEIYAVGVSGSLDLIYTKMDANGNLQWRNQIDMSNSFSMTNPNIFCSDDYLIITSDVGVSTTDYTFATRVPDDGSLVGTYQFPNNYFGGNIVYSNLTISGTTGGIDTWAAANAGFSYAVPTFLNKNDNFTSLTPSSQKKFL